MYEARISRNHPAAFLILIDQSGSMSEPTTFHGRRMSKSEAVALTVNMLIDELLNRCKREEGYRDYFDIAVQGYHGDRVVSLWGDPERTFMRPSELAGAELCRVDVQQERTLPGGKTVVSVISQKIWVRPLASDKTPMYSALRRCHESVQPVVRPAFKPRELSADDLQYYGRRVVRGRRAAVARRGREHPQVGYGRRDRPFDQHPYLLGREPETSAVSDVRAGAARAALCPAVVPDVEYDAGYLRRKHRPFARRGRRAFSRDELQCRNDGGW